MAAQAMHLSKLSTTKLSLKDMGTKQETGTIVLSPHFPGAHFPLGVEQQVASPEKAWFAMDCNHMEVQEGSLTGWMYGAFLECNKDVNLSFRTLTNLSLPGYLQETLLPKCL